jgi:hypothetical protein
MLKKSPGIISEFPGIFNKIPWNAFQKYGMYEAEEFLPSNLHFLSTMIKGKEVWP